MMRNLTMAMFCLWLSAAMAPAGGAQVTFSVKPVVKTDGVKSTISFTVSDPTDVEVAILDAKGVVVRHLAAGVLGATNAPPAPLKPGLAQSLEWDGRDDYGEPIAAAKPSGGAGFSVRVRAGMGVKLDQIAGGDPYAFYSREMGQGDHAAWRIMGIEVKPDGTVYVLGNANNFGPPALRAYSAGGEYQRTVYPPPAGKPVEAVKGWGVNIREDGTYAPQYNDLSSPALSKTIISGTRGRIATLIPSAGNDELLLEYDFKLMRVNTDGTILPKPMLDGLLINDPVPSDAGRTLAGKMQMAMAPDRKSFFLGGLFAGKMAGTKRIGAATEGPWRDGQIFQVDAVTRKAGVFFALDAASLIGDLDARGKSPIADANYGEHAALQGVAVDAAGRVFVCDRQNQRVLVLDNSGKILHEIPVAYPDAVAVHPKTQALYVTTRKGNYHVKGELKLLKFADWNRDTKPAVTLPLCEVGTYGQPTCLAVAESAKGVFLWVAYTALPVRIYRDTDAGLELVKDFYQAGPQRALDLQHMIADPQTEAVFISDGWGACFRVADWKAPQFVRCMQDAQTPLRALSLSIDPRSRRLFGHADRKPVVRYMLDGEFFAPAPAGNGNSQLTPEISNDWRIGLGFGDRGIAAAPDGSVAKLGALGKGPDYSGPIYFFAFDAAKAPWEPLLFTEFGRARSGGIRFDLRGNLYAGKSQGGPIGRIYRYAPTRLRSETEQRSNEAGSTAKGALFPTAPTAPAKVYDVPYGSIGPEFSRTPRFGVDGWGRIYYPTSLEPRVSAIDNEGNAILSFGTYGNRDSMGGLAGDLVPTKDIPMAWPNSVDATDDFIYVSDIVNIRLLRLAKTFVATESVTLK